MAALKAVCRSSCRCIDQSWICTFPHLHLQNIFRAIFLFRTSTFNHGFRQGTRTEKIFIFHREVYLAQYGGNWRSAELQRVKTGRFSSIWGNDRVVNACNIRTQWRKRRGRKIVEKIRGNSPSGGGGELRILTTDKDSPLFSPFAPFVWRRMFSRVTSGGESTSSDVCCVPTSRLSRKC